MKRRLFLVAGFAFTLLTYNCPLTAEVKEMKAQNKELSDDDKDDKDDEDDDDDDDEDDDDDHSDTQQTSKHRANDHIKNVQRNGTPKLEGGSKKSD